MEPYGVPEATLASPHYQDAILWVYSHMIVIGLLTGCLGIIAEGERAKKWTARLLLVVHLYYTYLDTRSSDSFLGNALYKGTASIAPALIVAMVSILFAHASFCTRSRSSNG
ncbi:hypothetical protein LVJ94_04200 [Pendulispora rubella]|uniref:Uncharacterized protein n=1 Tax=Pendulispora rubella TaxID=2741070 RepID=A0ABZ2LB43_9BACT